VQGHAVTASRREGVVCPMAVSFRGQPAKTAMKLMSLPNGGRIMSVELSLPCTKTPLAWLMVLDEADVAVR
jgi:hypothetical protein